MEMTELDKWTFKYTISSPTQDPFLLVDFLNDSETLLFDCGVRVWGQVKTILKIKHLFISHAHIDHMIGFDHIIRALLGENKRLCIYGPPGICQRISAKLNGYDWDRAADQELILEVNELNGNRRITQVHECRKRFELSAPPVESPWKDVIFEAKNYSVAALEVDHGGSPCMAYILTEKNHLRILKDKLIAEGLLPGVWVGEVLQSLEEGIPEDTKIDTGRKSLTLGEIRRDFIQVQGGKKIVYLTDTVYSEALVERLKPLAFGADVIVCESTFLDQDSDLAAKYHHMTARQAATIARECSARKLKLFHLSNRYFPKLNLFVKEARKVFPDSDLSTGLERHKRHMVRNRPARK